MEAINLFVKIQPQLKAAVEAMIATKRVRCSSITLNAGDYLFREGDDVRCTFYVQKGLVKLLSESAEGYSKTVFLHKAGTLLGFQGFQQGESNKPSILNAKAAMQTTVVAIEAADFKQQLISQGEVCYAMCEYLFSMMALQTREAVNTSLYPVLQRFAALLLKLASELGATEAPALIPFSNAELAEMLGVHVNSVANAISSLRKAGCVDKSRAYLAIIDIPKLQDISDTLLSEGL